jgi:hypothetical protein
MSVVFFKMALMACVQALVPNHSVVKTLLPEHQQAYIIQGAYRACLVELDKERQAACVEDKQYCGEL